MSFRCALGGAARHLIPPCCPSCVCPAARRHPDKQAEDEKIKERYLAVRQAYDIVSNEQKRERYNYILDHPLEHYAYKNIVQLRDTQLF